MSVRMQSITQKIGRLMLPVEYHAGHTSFGRLTTLIAQNGFQSACNVIRDFGSDRSVHVMMLVFVKDCDCSYFLAEISSLIFNAQSLVWMCPSKSQQ